MNLNTFFQEKKKELIRRKKLLKRKVFFLKAKVFLLWVLPAVIILLAVRILKTLLRIKLRAAAASVGTSPSRGQEPKDLGAAVKPISQTSFTPDFVTPVPVSQTSRDGDEA